MEDYLSTMESNFACTKLEDCEKGLYHFFCDFCTLKIWREELSIIFENVLKSSPEFGRLSANSHLYFGGHFIQLIYLAEYLSKNLNEPSITSSDWRNFILKKDLSSGSGLKDWVMLLPKNLDEADIENPFRYLKGFFDQDSCIGWVKRWNRIVYESISSDTLLDDSQGAYFFQEYRNFLGLLEASYLIYVRGFSQNRPTDYCVNSYY
ncbi:hypothetical protein [Algoriphagus sp. CAU 1675]|uniref:hypothetical protein n=1 Tax=Algoriphagus sp. CAU 1675 TaxID=3032597 RepID=UPI0023DB8640|nr:hypothetical protein [Algoriphagus sp. CAU 1675]MDF2156247.1 hypothetical protein [Algoriphagus sp. CAU 1675]